MAGVDLPLVWHVPASEYVPFVNDAIRVATILIGVQAMLCLQGGSAFDGPFFAFVVNNVLAVAMYWLVVRRLLDVRSDVRPPKQPIP